MTMLRALVVILAIAAVAPAPARPPPGRDGAVQQLRIYEIFDANRVAFHARFRDHAMRIMGRHGFDIVAMWEARTEDGPEFVYVLDWPDEATMRAAWEAFLADEEWIEIKRVTAARHGTLVGDIEERVLHLTDYSPPVRGGTSDEAELGRAEGGGERR